MNSEYMSDYRDCFVKIGDIIDFYEDNFKDLDDGIHWSRSDIINNLLNVPRFKAEMIMYPSNSQNTL